MSLIRVVNTISGRSGLVPENYLTHPILGANIKPWAHEKKRLINPPKKRAAAPGKEQ